MKRRRFVKAISSAGLGLVAARAPLFAKGSPNEKVVVGVMGLNGRGTVLARVFAKTPNATVAYVCDVDSQVLAKSATAVGQAQGTTPKAVYNTLAANRARLDWNKVLFFFGDERCVPPSHGESNFLMAETSLFRPVGIPETQVFRMKGEAEPEPASREYEAIMRRILPPASAGWPRFDLILLGLGQDGRDDCEAIFREARIDAHVIVSPNVPHQRLGAAPAAHGR